MSDFTTSRHGPVLQVLLTRNALNTLSPACVRELSHVLHDLPRDGSVQALVLASSAEKFFSAGWDLPALLHLGRAEMAAFLHEFNRLTLRLATLPVPTVAAVSGFAVAGGAIFALACDYRVMTRASRRIGLNEVDLGVPVPLPARLLLEGLVGGRVARDVLLQGTLYGPDEALAAGLVDRVVDADRLSAEALALAESLAAKPRGAVAGARSGRDARLQRRQEIDGPADESAFLDAFFAPATRELLAAAASRLVPR